MAILVTGGAGYIGAHTVLTLLERGDNVIVIDNIPNASLPPLNRVAELTGKSPVIYVADIKSRYVLKNLFQSCNNRTH